MILILFSYVRFLFGFIKNDLIKARKFLPKNREKYSREIKTGKCQIIKKMWKTLGRNLKIDKIWARAPRLSS